MKGDWRRRARMVHESEALRQRRMQLLAELAGKVERRDFSERELLEAEAALLQANPDAPQRSLSFRSTKHA